MAREFAWLVVLGVRDCSGLGRLGWSVEWCKECVRWTSSDANSIDQNFMAFGQHDASRLSR